MKTDEMKRVGGWILAALKSHDDASSLKNVRGEIAEFAKAFPVPGIA
jgi:glycine hydroxymethyltransferase